MKILEFLRLVDADHKLSLTNISVFITLYHLATTKNAITPIDLGALLAALASYQTKRLISKSHGSKKE